MAQKKGSKNAIENRGERHSDPRGEQVMVMIGGKKRLLFEKNGSYVNSKGEPVEI